MDKKLSELSKPVAWVPKSQLAMVNSGDALLVEADLCAVQRFNESPLYSQEYVSALLAEIERGNGYLEDVRCAKGCCENAIAVREKRIAELEAKLATPVQLNESAVMSRRYVVEAIRSAGFTVSEE